MPIDYEKAMATEPLIGGGSYDIDDVILYHLSLGAGNPPTDANELEYAYEKNLKVLPSFSVVAPVSSESGGFGGGNILESPGLEFNPALMLHGEQDIQIHKPLPPAAKLKSKMHIADIFDKGKAALVIVEINVSDEETDEALFTTRMSVFLRGEGGFGGDGGPKAGNVAPEREPDGVIEVPTLPQLALLYRLNGDKNPLHADPEYSAMGGFEQPIIHGLCSYGVCLKAIVDNVLDGDVAKVARYQVRFADVAFPGETYVVSYWKEDDKVYLKAHSKERGTNIITNAAVTIA